MKTMKIKKILIAMDYDETSQKVAEIGYSLAKSLNAKVSLLHVIYEQPVYYSTYPYMREFQVEIRNDLKKSTQEFLNKAKKHLDDETIKTVIKEGDISTGIIDTAISMKADIIVMGTHSRKWLENIIMGSVAESVMKKSIVPIFIIPTKKS